MYKLTSNSEIQHLYWTTCVNINQVIFHMTVFIKIFTPKTRNKGNGRVF